MSKTSYQQIIADLQNNKVLKKDQLRQFFADSVAGKLSTVQQAAVLSGLKVKGLDHRELSEVVKLLRQAMPASVRFQEAIDICGTGGSGLPRINTSTLSAFILSALGVPVAKHGNKAASGRFGSFDLLEKLGVNITAKPETLETLGHQLNLAFLYARQFHPVMKHFAPVRQQLGFPTLFNMVGPLLNPANTKTQLIGTSFEDQMELMAQTAKTLGMKNLMVVCGEDGLDEVTLTGKTKLVRLRNGKISRSTLSPRSFGVKPCSFKEIAGSSASVNTKIAMDILKGVCTTRHRDLVLVNTALALKLAGKAASLKKGYQMASEVLASGQVYQQFLAYQRLSNAPSILLQIAAHKHGEVAQRSKKIPLKRLQKKLEPSQRDFKKALLRRGLSLVAEIKKASPSAGLIRKKSFQAKTLARQYEAAGAAAISVLTDQKFFHGKPEYLRQVADETVMTPLLCKDFIVDPYQILEARTNGADAVLLIAALLSEDQLRNFRELAESFKMDALCEVHTPEELKRVLKSGASIIGINHRDLHSFSIDKSISKKLIKSIPKDKVVVLESGLSTKKDLNGLPPRADAVLMGTALMKSDDPGKKIVQLFGQRQTRLKICGVQSVREALHCQKIGVDYIGLNFVPSSERHISYQLGEKILKALRKNPRNGVQVVGVFQNQPISEVNHAAQKLQLDFVQLSGKESISDLKKLTCPVINGVSVTRKRDVDRAEKCLPHVALVLFDGSTPGSGQVFHHGLTKGFSKPFLLAGGISEENLTAFQQLIHPLGFDLASGAETKGKRDLKKISRLVALLNRRP